MTASKIELSLHLTFFNKNDQKLIVILILSNEKLSLVYLNLNKSSTIYKFYNINLNSGFK